MDQRLKGHCRRRRRGRPIRPERCSADQLKYFQTDEEIFVAPVVSVDSPAAVPPAASTQQVVVIRRASGDIPFIGEDASLAGV